MTRGGAARSLPPVAAAGRRHGGSRPCRRVLAIDDFGTGFSSLARLKQLPCRTLKVDSSLVADLPRDADSAAMTLAIVQLAGNLDVEPLAEGIETEAQAAFLTDVGCRFGQGFLFGRAMPADELEARLRQGRREAA